jgi:hypothetical protein
VHSCGLVCIQGCVHTLLLTCRAGAPQLIKGHRASEAVVQMLTQAVLALAALVADDRGKAEASQHAAVDRWAATASLGRILHEEVQHGASFFTSLVQS